MVARFICDVFPYAEEACKRTTEDAIMNPNERSNRAKSNDHVFGDHIGVAAYARALIKKEANIKRWYVRNAVIAHVRDELGLTFQDLPLKCLSQTVQDNILQQSIEFEREILGKDANEELLKLEFEQFKATKWK